VLPLWVVCVGICSPHTLASLTVQYYKLIELSATAYPVGAASGTVLSCHVEIRKITL